MVGEEGLNVVLVWVGGSDSLNVRAFKALFRPWSLTILLVHAV